MVRSRPRSKGTPYPYPTILGKFCREGRLAMRTAGGRTLCTPTFKAVQPLSMTVAASRLALCVAAVLVAASAGAAAAPAEDLAACYKAQGDAAISACTAAITSTKHQGPELATDHNA